MDSLIVDEFERACLTGDIETVEKFFYEYKVENVNMLKMRNLVVKEGHLNVLEYFYRYDVNLNEFYEYQSPLFIAIYKGWVDVTDFCIESGADVNIKDNNGGSALFRAAGSGHLEILDKLIINGGDIYHCDKEGQNLLFFAAISGVPDVFMRVLSFGFEINQQTDDGTTSLMIAVIYRNTEIVKILLEHGADPMIKDDEGKIALDFAEDPEIKNFMKTYMSSYNDDIKNL